LCGDENWKCYVNISVSYVKMLPPPADTMVTSELFRLFVDRLGGWEKLDPGE